MSDLLHPQVVYEVIQPLTKSHACRLTDFPDPKLVQTGDVGTPEYFIRCA